MDFASEQVADTAQTSAARVRRIARTPRARLTLTKIDRRFRFGRRINELTALFTAALGEGEITPMRRMRIAEAAQLKALAEQVRGEFMRTGVGVLDDIVRIERKADHAVKALGIVEGGPKAPSLAEYLASKHRNVDKAAE